MVTIRNVVPQQAIAYNGHISHLRPVKRLPLLLGKTAPKHLRAILYIAPSQQPSEQHVVIVQFLLNILAHIEQKYHQQHIQTRILRNMHLRLL